VAAAYLDACEERPPRWHLLRGRAYIAAGAFSAAVCELRRVEEAFPEQVLALLERCYKELGDFRKAYEYACKRRGE
jgi:lipopolysaccharide biosynthesis regulator YciM